MMGAKLALLLALCPVFAAPEPRFEFSLDPRLELSGVVEFLSRASGDAASSPGIFLPQPEERAVIERRFSSMLGHPAVLLHAEASLRAFEFKDRGHVLLRLTAPPDLAASADKPYGFLAPKTGGSVLLERWLDSLRAFARDSQFHEFYEAEVRRAEPEFARFEQSVLETDFLHKIEAYSGLSFRGRFSFLFSRFYKDMAAVHIQRLDDGAVRIAVITGSDDEAPPGSSRSFAVDPGMIWHEAAHGILDEYTDLLKEEFAVKRKLLRDPTHDRHDWEHYVREHIVCAVASRLVRAERGARAGELVLKEAEKEGLRHVRDFAKRLEEYEADRKRYPTLAEFYPRLVDAFPKAPPPDIQTIAGEKEWLHEMARPFPSPGGYARAHALLSSMLTRAARPELLVKRAVFDLLLNNPQRALLDAEAALAARPGDTGALRVRVLALAALNPAP